MTGAVSIEDVLRDLEGLEGAGVSATEADTSSKSSENVQPSGKERETPSASPAPSEDAELEKLWRRNRQQHPFVSRKVLYDCTRRQLAPEFKILDWTHPLVVGGAESGRSRRELADWFGYSDADVARLLDLHPVSVARALLDGGPLIDTFGAYPYGADGIRWALSAMWAAREAIQAVES